MDLKAQPAACHSVPKTRTKEEEIRLLPKGANVVEKCELKASSYLSGQIPIRRFFTISGLKSPTRIGYTKKDGCLIKAVCPQEDCYV